MSPTRVSIAQSNWQKPWAAASRMVYPDNAGKKQERREEIERDGSESAGRGKKETDISLLSSRRPSRQ